MQSASQSIAPHPAALSVVECGCARSVAAGHFSLNERTALCDEVE